MSAKWRVGRKVGRTIYNEHDDLIGVMDTPALAARVVEAVNACDALQARLAEAERLLREAADIAADHHDSWRCEHPDRYGRCEGQAACPTQRTAAAIRAFLAKGEGE